MSFANRKPKHVELIGTASATKNAKLCIGKQSESAADLTDFSLLRTGGTRLKQSLLLRDLDNCLPVACAGIFLGQPHRLGIEQATGGERQVVFLGCKHGNLVRNLGAKHGVAILIPVGMPQGSETGPTIKCRFDPRNFHATTFSSENFPRAKSARIELHDVAIMTNECLKIDAM